MNEKPVPKTRENHPLNPTFTRTAILAFKGPLDHTIASGFPLPPPPGRGVANLKPLSCLNTPGPNNNQSLRGKAFGRPPPANLFFLGGGLKMGEVTGAAGAGFFSAFFVIL